MGIFVKRIARSNVEGFEDPDTSEAYMQKLFAIEDESCTLGSVALFEDQRFKVSAKWAPTGFVWLVRTADCTMKARPPGTGRGQNQQTIRCKACHERQNTLKKKLREIEDKIGENVVHPNTNDRYVVGSPKKAASVIERFRGSLLKSRRENLRLKMKLRLKNEGTGCSDKKAVNLVHKAMEEANKHVNSQFPSDDDEPLRAVWKLHFEKMEEYRKAGFKKTSSIRFDPLLLQFAMGLLSKTSHSTYEQLSKVMVLPSRSYVSRRGYDIDLSPLPLTMSFPSNMQLIRKRKKMVGGNKICSRGVCVATIKSMRELARRHGWVKGSNERLGSLSFDSMKIRSGVGYDINNDFCGLDVTVPFEVLSQKFKKMVRHAFRNKDMISSAHSLFCSNLPGPWYSRGRTGLFSSSTKDKGGRPRARRMFRQRG
jgi:hypothetical protein